MCVAGKDVCKDSSHQGKYQCNTEKQSTLAQSFDRRGLLIGAGLLRLSKFLGRFEFALTLGSALQRIVFLLFIRSSKKRPF